MDSIVPTSWLLPLYVNCVSNKTIVCCSVTQACPCFTSYSWTHNSTRQMFDCPGTSLSKQDTTGFIFFLSWHAPVHVHVQVAKAAPQTWAKLHTRIMTWSYHIRMSIVDAWPFTWSDSTCMSTDPIFPSESVQTHLFEELGHSVHILKLWSGDETS